MLETMFPNLKVIHDIFSPVFTSAYHNERELFDQVITPIQRESTLFYEEYLLIFETIRTHTTTVTVEDAEKLVEILTSFQRDKYSERKEFFGFSKAMQKRVKQRVRNSDF